MCTVLVVDAVDLIAQVISAAFDTAIVQRSRRVVDIRGR
jgi:hypothetical protein